MMTTIPTSATPQEIIRWVVNNAVEVPDWVHSIVNHAIEQEREIEYMREELNSLDDDNN